MFSTILLLLLPPAQGGRGRGEGALALLEKKNRTTSVYRPIKVLGSKATRRELKREI